MNTAQIQGDVLYDCLIIGGGISSLSFAHYLAQDGYKVAVVEKKQSLGGQIDTRPATAYPDYWRELGAHSCYNSYMRLLSIVEDIGFMEGIQPLAKYPYMLYADGGIHSVWSQIAWGPLIRHGYHVFFSSRSGKTVREYFRPIVGGTNYNRLFSPLFRAVLSQPADDYPAALFLKKRKEKNKKVARKFTFKHGLSSFLEAIVAKDKFPVLPNAAVSSIEKKAVPEGGAQFEITLSDGRHFAARKLAIGTDVQSASHLLETIDGPLSALLKNIALHVSESVNVIVKKDALSLPPVAGIIPMDDSFLSAVSRDLVPDGVLRSFTFHFLPGGNSREEKISLILKVLHISPSDIMASDWATHVLPVMRCNHMKLPEEVKNIQTEKDLYMLGDYFYGLSLEDCVGRSYAEYCRFKG